MRLLLIEDTPGLGAAIVEHFRSHGHAIDWAQTLCRARAYLASEDYDLALLDIMLPDGDGCDLLDELRQHENSLPVLVLTARSQVADRVHLLDQGADDYVTKPFHFDELDARCRAILRRRGGQARTLVTLGSLQYDAAAAEVRVAGELVPFRTRELRLLEIFLAKPGQVLGKGQLCDKLVSLDHSVSENAIEVYVGRLRRLLHGASLEIETLRGQGYRLREVT